MSDLNGYRPLKGKKRSLSTFLAEEMMYDYVAGHLDADRRSAVEEYLKKSKDGRELELHLKGAMSYCDQLSKTQLSEPLMQKLVHSKSMWNRVIDFIAWSKWPEAARWTTEAFAVSLVVAFIVALSWPKLSQWFPERKRDVVLAEVDKKQDEAAVGAEAPASVTSSEKSEDVIQLAQNSQIKEENSSKPEASEKKQEVSDAEKVEEPTMVSAEKEKQVAEPQTKQAEEAKADSEEVEAAGVVEAEKAKPAMEKPKPKGFVYRAFMAQANIDTVTEDMRTQLVELGGQKAGQVRMGWRKPKGSYFHFSVPEANYDAVVSMLRSFGPVQIAKDPHWRVMPEGKIRIILWVEDLDLKNQNP